MIYYIYHFNNRGVCSLPNRKKSRLIKRLSRNLERVSPLNEYEIRRGIEKLKTDLLKDIAAIMLSLGEKERRRRKDIRASRQRQKTVPSDHPCRKIDKVHHRRRLGR